ncbi:MAG: alpha/beta fold hydrolase [Bacillota bacterium]
MPNVIIDGIQYHYSAKTPYPGEPEGIIVFIHGSGGSHANWAHQVAELGRNYMVLAPDLPGHAASGGKPGESIGAYAEFLYKFYNCVIGSPFVVAGHSMGGAVALDFALKYPDLLNGIILLGTGSRLRVLPLILEALKDGNIPDSFSSALFSQGTPAQILQEAERDLQKSGTKVLYSDLSACDRFDVSERLKEIENPALVITGENDLMTPVKYGRYLADNIKNASFHVLEGAGHMLMLEKPERVNNLIKGFLKERGC